ncbi:hypothetical protein [Neobacillus citreus]|uniref:Uncharacterized protein n=1 Tax=Neobacillus citreus TaxID=2833578 RepID=A0A942Y7K3_9BACI|nr:hypothetical protein [Neobacillus citreus]MCH6266809.1 hypothetical protein [Neobacillus citreus]
MSSSWKMNLYLGSITFLLTYLFSIYTNTWQTSLFRASIGFLLFFILGYVLRYLLYHAVVRKDLKQTMLNEEVEHTSNEAQAPYVDKVEGEEPSFQSVPLQSLHTKN